MTLRKLVNNILTEGVAEIAGQKSFDIKEIIHKETLKELSNQF